MFQFASVKVSSRVVGVPSASTRTAELALVAVTVTVAPAAGDPPSATVYEPVLPSSSASSAGVTTRRRSSSRAVTETLLTVMLAG